MYIPEIVIGFILGFVIGLLTPVVIALAHNKKHNDTNVK